MIDIMIRCPKCKHEYKNFLATQLKADLAKAEQKLMDANIKWAVEAKKVCTDLAAANESWDELHRLHLGELRQIAELKLKLKASEADLAAAEKDAKEWELVAKNNRTEADKAQADLKLCKNALEEYGEHAPDCVFHIDTCNCGFEQALNPKEIE